MVFSLNLFSYSYLWINNLFQNSLYRIQNEIMQTHAKNIKTKNIRLRFLWFSRFNVSYYRLERTIDIMSVCLRFNTREVRCEAYCAMNRPQNNCANPWFGTVFWHWTHSFWFIRLCSFFLFRQHKQNCSSCHTLTFNVGTVRFCALLNLWKLKYYSVSAAKYYFNYSTTFTQLYSAGKLIERNRKWLQNSQTTAAAQRIWLRFCQVLVIEPTPCGKQNMIESLTLLETFCSDWSRMSHSMWLSRTMRQKVVSLFGFSLSWCSSCDYC